MRFSFGDSPLPATSRLCVRRGPQRGDVKEEGEMSKQSNLTLGEWEIVRAIRKVFAEMGEGEGDALLPEFPDEVRYEPEPELTIQQDLWPFLCRHSKRFVRLQLEELLSLCGLTQHSSMAEFADKLVELSEGNPEADRMLGYVEDLLKIAGAG